MEGKKLHTYTHTKYHYSNGATRKIEHESWKCTISFAWNGSFTTKVFLSVFSYVRFFLLLCSPHIQKESYFCSLPYYDLMLCTWCVQSRSYYITICIGYTTYIHHIYIYKRLLFAKKIRYTNANPGKMLKENIKGKAKQNFPLEKKRFPVVLR